MSVFSTTAGAGSAGGRPLAGVRGARLATVACAAVALALPAAAAGAAPSRTTAANGQVSAASAPNVTGAACSTRWGSGAKGPRVVTLSRTTLRDVRAGSHPCFDRIVLDVSSRLSDKGYRVGYVSQVRQDGSGEVVPLRGRAKLQVTLGAPAYDSNGRPTYVPRNPRELVRASSLKAVKQVAWGGSFEGQTTLGVGVDRSRAFRAFVLHSRTGPDRLVIDIANR